MKAAKLALVLAILALVWNYYNYCKIKRFSASPCCIKEVTMMVHPCLVIREEYYIASWPQNTSRKQQNLPTKTKRLMMDARAYIHRKIEEARAFLKSSL